MLKNFLSKTTHSIFLATLLFLWLFSFISLFFLILIAYIFCWYLFRRQAQEDIDFDNSISSNIYSPVNGKLKEITTVKESSFFGRDLYCLRMTVGYLSEYSITLPAESEVLDFHYQPVSGPFRWWNPDQGLLSKALGVCLRFKTKKSGVVGIQFLRCFLGLWPELSIVPGDRGKPPAVIGHFPLGGTVLVYIPKNYEIMVTKGDQLIAGTSMLAKTSI